MTTDTILTLISTGSPPSPAEGWTPVIDVVKANGGNGGQDTISQQTRRAIRQAVKAGTLEARVHGRQKYVREVKP